jgi:hypothetical protein
MLAEVNLGSLLEHCGKLGVFLATLLLSSCFDPEIPACLRCPSGACPNGQSCVDGFCAKKGQQCGALEQCLRGKCCLGAACFELGAQSRLALWLDWSTITPQEVGQDLGVWRDRSSLEHDARPFGDNKLVVSRGPLGRGNVVVEARFGTEGLEVDEGSGDALGTLGSRDFVLLVAVALPCQANTQDYCLFQKLEPIPTGFWLRAESTGQLTGFMAAPGASASAFVLLRPPPQEIACDGFHVFGLRRVTGSENESRVEVRLDGRAVGSQPFAGTLNADGAGRLQLGAGRACGNLVGSIAFAVAVEGPLGDIRTAELEKFVLKRLAEAGFP